MQSTLASIYPLCLEGSAVTGSNSATSPFASGEPHTGRSVTTTSLRTVNGALETFHTYSSSTESRQSSQPSQTGSSSASSDQDTHEHIPVVHLPPFPRLNVRRDSPLALKWHENNRIAYDKTLNNDQILFWDQLCWFADFAPEELKPLVVSVRGESHVLRLMNAVGYTGKSKLQETNFDHMRTQFPPDFWRTHVKKAEIVNDWATLYFEQRFKWLCEYLGCELTGIPKRSRQLGFVSDFKEAKEWDALCEMHRLQLGLFRDAWKFLGLISA